MTEIPALNFIITVKGGRKNIGLQTNKRLMQKTQWPQPLWNSQGSFRISIGSHSFPVHAFPSFPAFRVSKNSRDSLTRNPRQLHCTTYLELSCWNKFPFTNAIGEPVNGHEDYCVSYCCRFQGIHTTLIIYLARKKHVGRTSIKVTTHSSSKWLDFLCVLNTFIFSDFHCFSQLFNRDLEYWLTTILAVWSSMKWLFLCKPHLQLHF